MIHPPDHGVWAAHILRYNLPDDVFLVALARPGLQEPQQLILLFAHMVAEHLLAPDASLYEFLCLASELPLETLMRFQIASIINLSSVEDVTVKSDAQALRHLGE